MKVTQAIDRFLVEWSVERNLADHTTDGYARGLRSFFRPLLTASLSAVTERACVELGDGLRRSLHHNTYLYRVSVARLFTGWCRDRGLLPVAPMARWRLRRPRRAHHPVLTSEQVASLAAKTDVSQPYGLRDHAMILVAYEAALRFAELRGLKRHHVEGAPDALPELLYVETVKGGEPRRVPLSAEATTSLATYIRFARPHLFKGPDPGYLFLSGKGKPLSHTTVYHKMLRLGVQAGIPFKVTPHVLRHSRATWWADKGLNPYYLQGMLGHRNLESSMHYVHLAQPNAIEAVRRLNQPYYREIAP